MRQKEFSVTITEVSMHAELSDCSAFHSGKLASQHLYGAACKAWSHLYLLKELTKFKTDREMEYL